MELLILDHCVSGGKRRRVRLPIEDQLEIVRRFDAGEKAGRIATDCGMKDSSVRAIIKRKEELKKLEQSNEMQPAFSPASNFQLILNR